MSAQLSTFQTQQLLKLKKCPCPKTQMDMVISFYNLISFKDDDPRDTEVYELIRTTLDYFIEKYGRDRVMSVYKKCRKTKNQEIFFTMMFDDE